MRPSNQAPLDRWTNLVAAWSQVVTVCVVIFGYFYTVRPVYERDRLQEDVSRLEAAADKLRAKAKEASRTARTLQRQTADLQGVRTRLEEELSRLTTSRKQLQQVNAMLDSKLKRSEDALARAQANALELERISEEAQKRLVRDAVTWSLSIPAINGARGDVATIWERSFWTPTGLSQRLRDSWVGEKDAISQILSKVDASELEKLPVQQRVVASELAAIRNRLELYSVELDCPAPDFDAWEARAVEARKIMDQRQADGVPTCIENQVRDWALLNKWTDRQLEAYRDQSWFKGYVEEFSERCRAEPYFREEQLAMREAWSNLSKPCMDHVFAVIGKIVGEPVTSSKHLEFDWSVLVPPTVESLTKPREQKSSR